MSEDRREKGLAMMATLFGAPSGSGSSMPMPLQRYTTEHLFGDVWQQDDLTLQERSLATCTMLIALNRPEEMRVHFTGAKISASTEKSFSVSLHMLHTMLDGLIPWQHSEL